MSMEATLPVDYEALICLGIALAGGVAVVRCHDDEDASFFIDHTKRWARDQEIPVLKDRSWRLVVGDFADAAGREKCGTIEVAPHDYAGATTEVVRDLPAMPKAA